MQYSSVIIIYNPHSTGDSEVMAKELYDVLRKRLKGVAVERIGTKYAGHAEKIARQAAEDNDAPLIISSSGDGGYNEVINGVMAATNPRAVCAVLSAGNANDHSRTMQDTPLSDSILSGKVTQLDVLKMEVKRSGKTTVRYAHSYIGLGLTPVVAVELNRHSLNALRECLIVLRTFFKYRPFKISRGGKVLKLDSLLFGNINQMAKVLKIAPHNRPDDGKFEVVSFPAGKKWQLVKRIAQAAVTKIENVSRASCYEFTVLKNMPIQLDGEVTSLKAGDKVQVIAMHKALTTVV